MIVEITAKSTVLPILTRTGNFALGFGTDVIPSIAMKVLPPSSVNEINHEFGTLYPNPATDELTVSLDQGYGKALLTVVDVTGRQVHSEARSTNTMQVDVS